MSSSDLSKFSFNGSTSSGRSYPLPPRFSSGGLAEATDGAANELFSFQGFTSSERSNPLPPRFSSGDLAEATERAANELFSFQGRTSSGRSIFSLRFSSGGLAEAADRGNEAFAKRRDDKEEVFLGSARNWARPCRQAAGSRLTNFTVLKPSTTSESSSGKNSLSESDAELRSNKAEAKKLTIQEEKEALKKRLGEIEVIELKDLESLLEKRRSDLKEMKNHFKVKLEAAFAAVNSLQTEEAVKCSEIEQDIVDLAAKISDKKENQPDLSIKSCLECPICLEICKPPTQVWQCPEGHILCGSCSAKPEVVVCPQCRVKLAGRLSRGRVLEEMARKIFPNKGLVQ